MFLKGMENFMGEYEIQSLFNSFLISNAIFFAGNAFLLWVAFRASLGVRDNGGNLVTKILVSLFGLGIVFLNLQNPWLPSNQLGIYSLCFKSARYYI